MSQKKKPKRPARQSQPAGSSSTLLIVLGGVVLIGLAVFLIAGNQPTPASPVAPEVTGAPSLKADKEKIDLGNVPLGQTVSVSFELANVGDQPLRLTGMPYVEVVEGC